jgi:sulfite exporter TauE/SafE
MSWQEGVGIVLVCIGLLGGAFAVAQRPAFWIEFGGRLIKALMPRLVTYVTKRMDPKTEAEWRKCQLRGGKWDHRRKRCDR